jgi:hypothetical protein
MKNEKISHLVLIAEILIIVLLHLNKGQDNPTVTQSNQSVKTFSSNNQPTSIFVVSQAPR